VPGIVVPSPGSQPYVTYKFDLNHSCVPRLLLDRGDLHLQRNEGPLLAMLLLDSHNLLIHTILTDKFAASSPSAVDQVITDFDNVQFHLSNPTGPDDKPIKTIIHLSMAIKCYKDLVQYGAKDILEREYKSMIIKSEPGYDFTIEINLEHLPHSQGIFTLLLQKY